MSTGGTKANRQQSLERAILAKMKVLRPGPKDVLVLKVADKYLEDAETYAEENQGIRQLMKNVAEVTGRFVVVLPQSADMETWTPPTEAPPTLIVPQGRVHLPPGVNL